MARTDPAFLAVARGDAPADLILAGGRVVNVFTRELVEANVAIKGGRIAGVGAYTDGARAIDVAGRIVSPGFIDAHMHVESTMMTPSQFVRVAVPRGTTGVVFDPHEIANVLGAPGIRWLMDASVGLPMNILFAVSSCVPASHLETSGARLEAADLAPFFDDERVVALAEMMNYPGVVFADEGVLAKVRLGLERAIVDGHAPGLTGNALQAYVGAGVSSDHECSTPEEAAEKLALGMTVYIREGSAARNLEALLPLVTPANAHQFCFCTDDRHPADLIDEGHIDHVVRRAISRGLDPCTAIAMGSLHVASHYRQPDIGAIAPGRFADLVVYDDVTQLRAQMTYFHGDLVGDDDAFVGDARDQTPAWPRSPIRIPTGLDEASFRVPAIEGDIRVIGMRPGQLLTDDLRMRPSVVAGACVADPSRDLLKMAVIERHRATGNIGLGFVRGFRFARGAIASTVGHDSHNLTIVGATDADMLLAARTLEKAGGGHCVVRDGDVLCVFPLPIAGLMSDRPAQNVANMQRELLKSARALGCPLDDPFMPLSFLPLCVIPSLKLSDLGLVDVNAFEIVPLEAPGP
jgi:adenine deaminase